MGCVFWQILMDDGRKLAEAELATLSEDAKNHQVEFNLDLLKQMNSQTDELKPSPREGKIESKIVNFFLCNGSVRVKAVVPQDPSAVSLPTCPPALRAAPNAQQPACFLVAKNQKNRGSFVVMCHAN